MHKAANPLVSVVIPTYNRAHLVGRAIQSVLEQTYEDFELIIVDDGSTDDTRQVVEALGDPRLQYVRHKHNRGAPAARNRGIEVSAGEYVAFLDSDDRWLPNKLERQLRIFGEGPSDLGVVYTGMQIVDLGSGEILRNRLPHHRGDIHMTLLRRNVVGTTSTPLIRRSFLERSDWFDESLPARQDADLWIRLAKHCSFDYVSEILAVIYVHGDRITENSHARIEGAKLVFQKIRDDLEEDPQLLSEGHHFLARELCKGGRFGEARLYLLKAIRSYPLRPKYYGTLVASFLGPNCFGWVQEQWVRLKHLARPRRT